MNSLSSQQASDWLEANRANWDERVAYHLDAPSYSLDDLRDGNGKLHPIEDRELGNVQGKRILHLQCHFGRDTLALAQRGADVVGLDFSPAAIDAARQLAAELNLSSRAQFVVSNVYDAATALEGRELFDIVFVTWGSLCWLPDVAAWAQVVAQFLRPGGFLYLADAHPSAMVLEDVDHNGARLPVLHLPYFTSGAIVEHDPRDYANSEARLENAITHEWMHSLSSILSGIGQAGLRLDWFHEHPQVPWRMFAGLVPLEGGLYGWPQKQWIPLSFSLKATA